MCITSLGDKYCKFTYIEEKNKQTAAKSTLEHTPK